MSENRQLSKKHMAKAATKNPPKSRLSQRASALSADQLAQFNADGYLVARNFCKRGILENAAASARDSLSPPIAPVEYETDLQYPGAPPERKAPGGDTVRRLLNAFARDKIFRDWALNPAVARFVREMLAVDAIRLSQNHHNCIMTKHPGYGSSTGWHQDIRYWTFDRPELVTVWLALGDETEQNGALRVIPGSHRMRLDRGLFDAALFLRDDLPENQNLLDTAVTAELNAGDALFFHCRLIHSAGRNHSDSIKLSVVYTYRADNNRPIDDTRSSRHPDILLPKGRP